jgi:hypothetical protein
MAVYFDVVRLLRNDPELMKEYQARGGAEREAELDAWLKRLVDEGAFRRDATLEDIQIFISVVANGVALARSLKLDMNADALLRLVHGGIDPRHK